jgi:predicted RNase H-like HicB family nuclease
MMKQPYHWVFIPDPVSGFTGLILEFPGCMTQGETLQETYENLQEATELWLETTVEDGESVPEPVSGWPHG